MTISSYKPQIWATPLLENLNNIHVYAALGTRQFEGEIKNKGDTVRINAMGKVSVSPYVPDTTLITYEELNTSDQTLTITEDQMFAFQVHDADEIQAAGEFRNDAMMEAAWGISDVADTFVAEMLRDNVATVGLDGLTNQLGVFNVGTGAGDDDMYEVLVDMWVRLRKNNVPPVNNWAVVPAEAEGLLLKDPRFVSFGTEGSRRTITNGAIGEMRLGMRVYISNNVPQEGGNDVILAGYSGSFGYAEQIPAGQPEAIRLEQKFADGIRGRHLYGAKTIRPFTLSSAELNFV